jgi:alpha-glucosidase
MSPEVRAKYLSNIPFFDREGVHEIYRGWRKILDSYSGDKMSVAEAWVHPTSRGARYVRNDELHQIFNFDFLMIDWNAAAIRESIDRTIAELKDVGAPPTWVLNNHDSSRVASRLGGEDKARAMAMLIHALPGGIYVYQGEELGLPDVDLPDEARQDPAFFRSNGKDKGRDQCRVPLPWSSTEANYGFTTGKPWLQQPATWSQYARDVEAKNPRSFLNLYKASLSLRRSHPALGGEGSVTWVESAPEILHFTRVPGLEVIVNTGSASVSVASAAAELLLASGEGVVLEGGNVVVPANTTAWFQR